MLGWLVWLWEAGLGPKIQDDVEVLMAHYRSHALRLGRVSLANQVYLITTVTKERAPVFRDLFLARHVVRALMTSQSRAEVQTLAFVVMPDHLHWLFQLGERKDLADVVGGVKSVVAHSHGGSLWQEGFHDHAVRKEEDIKTLARYVVMNPVRAGLVERLGNYPHWDAVWL